MFSQASTMRENLHCWRPGATATPLSSLNHTCSPRLTRFVIASCVSCVTTACSIDVRARNIILTFNVARRRTDRFRRSRKQSLPPARGKSEEPQAFEGLSHGSAVPHSQLHLSLLSETTSTEAFQRSRQSLPSPSQNRSSLSIDRA